MRRVGRIVASIVAGFVLLALLVPLVWPVPALEDTVAPRELAFDDSHFLDVDGVTLHYRTAGEPEAPVALVLLHGFGASTYSWRDQLPLLADRAYVVAVDRPPFGLSERPLPPYATDNPYTPAQSAEQVITLMDALGIEQAVLVGHSAGAPIALEVAVRDPERVVGLVLESPAVYQARSTPAIASALLRSPQLRRIGPLLVRRIAGEGADDFIRSAYYDPDVATPEVLAGYRLPLRTKDWDRGLWELVAAPRHVSSDELLGQIDVPTLVIAGKEDTFVPFGDSAKVSEAIRGATLVPFAATGHLPHEEDPERFANEIFRYLDVLPEAACDT